MNITRQLSAFYVICEIYTSFVQFEEYVNVLIDTGILCIWCRRLISGGVVGYVAP